MILERFVFATGNGLLSCGAEGIVGLVKVVRLGEGVPNPERIGVVGDEAVGWGNSKRRNDSPLLTVRSANPEAVVSFNLLKVLRLGEGVPNPERIGVVGNEGGGWGNSERRNDSPLLMVLSANPEAVVSCDLVKALRLGEGVPNPERIGVVGNEAGGWGNSERRNDSPLLMVLSANPEAVVSCESAEACLSAEGARESPRCLDGYIADVETGRYQPRVSNRRVGHTGLQASPGSLGGV